MAEFSVLNDDLVDSSLILKANKKRLYSPHKFPYFPASFAEEQFSRYIQFY